MTRYALWTLIALLPLALACRLSPGQALTIGALSAAVSPPPEETGGLEIPEQLVRDGWTQYKQRFIQEDGRVIDRKGNGASTSEGQSYAMLRAVWMDDRATFDRVFKWADDNLNAGIRQDRLYGWKWGPRDDGSWGIYDKTAASDADQIIAYALILAEARWGDAQYLERARGILRDIWEKETREVAGRRYLLPGDWAVDGTPMKLNPSYYLPFAYRAFARIDPDHAWTRLIDMTYVVMKECRSRVGLPADWCQLDPKSGNLAVSYDVYDTSSDFGYEAFRVCWNMAADHIWYSEPRALAALQGMDWLRRYWSVRRELPAVLTVDGIPRALHESLGMYGAYLPALARIDPTQATLLFRQEIAPVMNGGMWGDPEDYYVQNWVWFGLALQGKVARP